MVSDSLNPYEIDEEESLDYTFITKDGIKYHASFYSVEPLYPEFVDTYSFSIEPEDKRSHPMDRRIAITIAEILKRLIVISDFVLLNASNDTQRSRNGIMDILHSCYWAGNKTDLPVLTCFLRTARIDAST